MKIEPGSTTPLLDALDFEALSPEEKETMLVELNELIFKGSVRRLMEQMDDRTRVAFAAFMETDPDEASFEAFVNEHVPDSDRVVAETIQEITGDILAVTGNK